MQPLGGGVHASFTGLPSFGVRMVMTAAARLWLYPPTGCMQARMMRCTAQNESLVVAAFGERRQVMERQRARARTG